jgi:hypothetical protein
MALLRSLLRTRWLSRDETVTSGAVREGGLKPAQAFAVKGVEEAEHSARVLERKPRSRQTDAGRQDCGLFGEKRMKHRTEGLGRVWASDVVIAFRE